MAAEINGVKPKFHLLDHNFINQKAYLMTIMQDKHKAKHYQDVQLDLDYVQDKVWRHFVDIKNGVLDEESGLHPAVHLGCIAMILFSQQKIDTDSQKPDEDMLDIVREAMDKLKTI